MEVADFTFWDHARAPKQLRHAAVAAFGAQRFEWLVVVGPYRGKPSPIGDYFARTLQGYLQTSERVKHAVLPGGRMLWAGWRETGRGKRAGKT